ncbi:hypothetical protein SS50377_23995 [Spironucleus salmonicida]|uniref:Uncharacterized protein n=1 Tax=Spironucleus salmonicida TaxID=348837 RepID=A0A9P8RYZ8_9EUKA|nr:hypothetical protein SS50377_23995 [Spironucleus salmonicida]
MKSMKESMRDGKEVAFCRWAARMRWILVMNRQFRLSGKQCKIRDRAALRAAQERFTQEMGCGMSLKATGSAWLFLTRQLQSAIWV